jgi:hypothetical protein
MLIPAPADTRAASPLVFYDAQVTDEGTVDVIGCDEYGQTLTQLHIEPRDDHGFHATVTEDGRLITIDAGIVRAAEGGDVIIEGRIDGEPFTITGSREQARVTTDATLDEDTARVLSQWARLHDPLGVLTQALRIPEAQFDAGGDTAACGIALSTLVVGAAECALSVAVSPLLAAHECGLILGEYSTYSEHC